MTFFIEPSRARGAPRAMMSFMKKQLTKFLLAVSLLASGVHVSEAAPRKQTTHVAKVSIEDARKTALARVPGTIKSEELEKEDGRWIYSFIVKPDGGRAGFVKEVNVDADTGVVVDVETEREK